MNQKMNKTNNSNKKYSTKLIKYSEKPLKIKDDIINENPLIKTVEQPLLKIVEKKLKN
jgi:hypothetical protein